MASDPKYSIEMIWSRGDGVYLAQVKELPGCLADGATPEEALQNLRIIIDEWIETAKEEGRKVPPPLTLEAAQRNEIAARQQLENDVEAHVQAAVETSVQQLFQAVKALTGRELGSKAAGWREGGFTRLHLSDKHKA